MSISENDLSTLTDPTLLDQTTHLPVHRDLLYRALVDAYAEDHHIFGDGVETALLRIERLAKGIGEVSSYVRTAFQRCTGLKIDYATNGPSVSHDHILKFLTGYYVPINVTPEPVPTSDTYALSLKRHQQFEDELYREFLNLFPATKARAKAQARVAALAQQTGEISSYVLRAAETLNVPFAHFGLLYGTGSAPPHRIMAEWLAGTLVSDVPIEIPTPYVEPVVEKRPDILTHYEEIFVHALAEKYRENYGYTTTDAYNCAVTTVKDWTRSNVDATDEVPKLLNNVCRSLGILTTVGDLREYFAHAPGTFVQLPSNQIENYVTARTQKVRGTLALGGHHSLPHPTMAFHLPLNERDIRTIKTSFKETAIIFVRPCPTVPRHGFVDSQQVINYVDKIDGPKEYQDIIPELRRIERETLAADPKAELLIMPWLAPTASAVVTPTTVSVGPGNDGATQGHGALTLPLTHVDINNGLRQRATVKDTPYIEVVSGSFGQYFVQCRDGVAPPSGLAAGANYVTVDTVVKDVLYVNNYCDNALAFEKAAKEAIEGTVLFHPGGSLLSHYSQHAILRGLPIVFGGIVPVIGSTLTATVSEQLPVKVTEFRRGILRAGNVPLLRDDDQTKAIKFALVMVHNASTLSRDAVGAELLGMAVVFLVRLAYAACLGEYRHVSKDTTRSRDSIYSAALLDFSAFYAKRSKVFEAHNSFLNSGNWRSGFGGLSWAACADSAIALERSIVYFLRESSEGRLNDIIGTAHNVVNCAHNNGPFLSKFVSAGAFGDAAHGELGLTVSAIFAAFDYARSTFEPITSDQEINWRRTHKVHVQKVEKPSSNQLTLQFTYRAEKSLYHFQYGKKGQGYVSADVPAYLCSGDVNEFLGAIVGGPADRRSFASGKDYWKVSLDLMPDDLKRMLKNNHIVIN